MSRDLTAILVRPKGSSLVDLHGRPAGAAADEITPEWVESVVRERGRPAILRIAPLAQVGLVQVEIADIADGLPLEDPELVAALSKRGAATFVHVNHEAGQAIVHGFDAGEGLPGFVGAPGVDFTAQLQARLGCDLDALHAADDQSRAGIGIVASRTAAVLPGRSLALPVGMPSALGSFVFHDRAIGDAGEAERCIFLGFDRPLTEALLGTPGAELAKVIEAIGQSGQTLLDPEATTSLIATLRALGDRPMVTADPAARPELVRAAEALVLSSGRVFSAGDRVDFWNDRVLPLLSLADVEPVIEAGELEELERAESVLHALIEVVPSAAPPGGAGSVLESIADRELQPLLPPLAEDGQYAGSVLTLRPERLLEQLRTLDGDRLSKAVARLEHAWYRAKSGQPPEGEGFEAFRKALGERGQADVDRVLRHLSELRVVFEVAAVNDLTIAIAFYG